MTNDTTLTKKANELPTAAPEETARTGGGEASDDASTPVSPADTEGAVALPERDGGEPDIDPRRLDADAVRVLLRLRQNGHEAYLVGGCVRDLLVGLTPKDFDIATSATPNQVRALFRNCRLIGRRFRLAHVYFKGGKILEVSTFRATPMMVEEPQPSEAAEGEVHSEGTDAMALADQEALDAVEHDEEVPADEVEDVQDAESHTPPAAVGLAPVPAALPDLLITEDNTFGTAVEDAVRRDFTVNGLFYDPAAGRVIDYVDGLRDLAGEQIRTIGDPEKRLREDPVRILRAVRFACKLGFDIESRTYAAMEAAVEDLPRCSAPRLLEDTFRLIRGGHAEASLKLLKALDALEVLLPPVAAYLDRQEEAGREAYWSLVRAMDAQVRAGVAFDDSMLLACVLLPLALEEPDTDTGGDEGGRPQLTAQAVETLLRSLVQKARLPRRIAERCRMVLLAQRTMAGLRRRRGGLMGFRGHPLFRETLTVFEVWVKATGEHKEALEKWKSGAAPTPTEGAEGPSRRRRRRRGGRRERGEGGGEGEGGEAAAESESPGDGGGDAPSSSDTGE